MLTEKLKNCNGFYPSFLKLRQRQRIFVQLSNFRPQCEAFINADTGRFDIQTGDMGPPWQHLNIAVLNTGSRIAR